MNTIRFMHGLEYDGNQNATEDDYFVSDTCPASYFVRKMIVLQKLTTMDWLGRRLRNENEKDTMVYPRMYFRYESLSPLHKILR